MMRRIVLVLLAAVVVAAQAIDAQVTSERLVNTAREPQNWLTYGGGYDSQRYSLLNRITPANAKDLELKWVYQTFSTHSFQTTPIVVDGVMYLTSNPNDITAIDAATGRPFWIFKYTPQTGYKACCGAPNRGVAVLGDTVFMGTVDAHLIALDAVHGQGEVEHDGRQHSGWLRRLAGAARGQGQGHHRHGRRRVPDARLHRGLQRAYRQGGLEVQHHSGPRRTGPRYLAG
jgi:glucose dehydrogenase